VKSLKPTLAERALALWPSDPDVAQRWDAVALMRRAGMEPDPMQQRVVTTPGHQLVLAHRQRGKSQIAASLAFEDALTFPGCLDLVVSRSLRQSGELFRKIKEFYNLTTPLPLTKDTEHELELSNGSRIISLPGNPETLVGYSSVHRLILDEAARIPDATYYALRPMLARSGGTILAISTPFGRRGWFYEAYTGEAAEQNLDVATVERLLADLDFPIEEYSEPGLDSLPCDVQPSYSFQWTKTFAPVTWHPRLSKAYIANERLNVPALWFDQEWMCKFVELGNVVFRYEDLQQMLSDDVVPIFGADGGLMDDTRILREDVFPLALNGH
jgi:Terminase large subunit, T4likevirus-type, N-terminal